MATKVYIDQGHNPVNPNAGAEGNGLREQDLVFVIGRELADVLDANGFETRLSRPSATTQLGTSLATSLAARRFSPSAVSTVPPRSRSVAVISLPSLV